MTQYRLISDMSAEYYLITDSQEIASILDDLNITDEYGCLFVKATNGDYSEIWGCASTVPYLHHEVARIRP